MTFLYDGTTMTLSYGNDILPRGLDRFLGKRYKQTRSFKKIHLSGGRYYMPKKEKNDNIVTNREKTAPFLHHSLVPKEEDEESTAGIIVYDNSVSIKAALLAAKAGVKHKGDDFRTSWDYKQELDAIIILGDIEEAMLDLIAKEEDKVEVTTMMTELRKQIIRVKRELEKKEASQKALATQEGRFGKIHKKLCLREEQLKKTKALKEKTLREISLDDVESALTTFEKDRKKMIQILEAQINNLNLRLKETNKKKREKQKRVNEFKNENDKAILFRQEQKTEERVLNVSIERREKKLQEEEQKLKNAKKAVEQQKKNLAEFKSEVKETNEIKTGLIFRRDKLSVEFNEMLGIYRNKGGKKNQLDLIEMEDELSTLLETGVEIMDNQAAQKTKKKELVTAIAKQEEGDVLVEMKENLKETEKAIEDLKVRIEAVSAQDDCLSKMIPLTKQIKEINDKIDVINENQNELKKKEKQIAETEQTISQIQAIVLEIENGIDITTVKIAEIRNSIEDNENNISLSEKALTAEKEALQVLVDEAKKIKTDIKAENDRKDTYLQKANADEAELWSDKEAKRKKIEDLKSEISEIEADQEKTSKEIKEDMEQIYSLRERLRIIKADIDAMQRSITDMEQKYTVSSNKAADLTEKISKKEEKLEEAKNKMSSTLTRKDK